MKSAGAAIHRVQLFPDNCSAPFPALVVRNSVAANVKRIASASPVVSGTFDIEYDGLSITGSHTDQLNLTVLD